MTADDVTIRQQARRSLPLRATPEGLVALIAQDLDPGDEAVRRFVQRGIKRMPDSEPPGEPMSGAELDDAIWA